MADLRQLSTEELLAQLGASVPTATSIPTVSTTSTPELSWWERGRQAANAPITGISGMFGVSTPQEYAKSWRELPAEGAGLVASLGGAEAGASVGALAAPFTGGLSIPAGAVIGGALGTAVKPPINAVIDYLYGTGITPEQRVSEAKKEALVGAGLDIGLRSIVPAYRFASPVVRSAYGKLQSVLGPATQEEAQRLVGQELQTLASRDVLAKAAEEKAALEAAGLPASKMTTAQLTGVEELAQAEQLLKTQPLGDANITFFNQARNQIDEINQAALAKTALADPNPKKAGEAARSLLVSARESARTEAGAKFTEDVRNIVAPIEGIAKDAKSLFKSVYQDTKVLTPSGDLGELYKKVRQLEATPPVEKAAVGFGQRAAKAAEKPTTTTVGTLQDMRSRALELAREAGDGSREELFADKLVNLLGKRIDAIKGTESLSEARSAWRQFKQRWYRADDGQLAPLAKLLRKQNPEDIITSVGKKSAVSDEYAKVLGGLEPNKLAIEMADFANQATVEAKLKWIQNKRAVYADSPIWKTVQGWESILKKIKASGEAGNVPALATKNIDFQASALVRALGGAGRQAVASPAEASALSAGANMTRAALTGFVGGTTAGTIFGIGAGPLTSSIQRRAGLTAATLAEALQDPATALKFVDDANKFGFDQAKANIAAQATLAQRQAAVSEAAPIGVGILKSLGLFTPQDQVIPPTQTPADSYSEYSNEDLIKLLQQSDTSPKEVTAPTPEPVATPQSESIKVGKQDVSIPVGEQYAPPNLVKAMIDVESSFDPKAVSPKKAKGLMQLMPGTASDLGLAEKDIFDPNKNVEAGSRYMKQQMDQIPDLQASIAAYNWGIGNVLEALDKAEAKGKPRTWASIRRSAPTETQRYVDKVLMKYRMLEA
jgi:soluble lytic murein transglycosylase-like protein